jgi:hypothetical protein
VIDCLIFNDHCLPLGHQSCVDETISDFLKTCISARNMGFKTILVDQHIDPSWYRIELNNGYFFRDWFCQQKTKVNREIVRAFLSIATHSPFFSTDDIADDVDLFEVLFNGFDQFVALRAAAWHDAPLVGFMTRAPWTATPLHVTIHQLNPATSEIASESRELQNYYSYSVFEQQIPRLQERRNAALNSGNELLAHFEDFYPKLILCGEAMSQLSRWSASPTLFNQVKESLAALSLFAQKWHLNEFTQYTPENVRSVGLEFQLSGESSTVSNTPKLRKEREFWLPSGRMEYFEQHVKLTSGYRLHFFPDNTTREIYVAYIGPHLRLK